MEAPTKMMSQKKLISKFLLLLQTKVAKVNKSVPAINSINLMNESIPETKY